MKDSAFLSRPAPNLLWRHCGSVSKVSTREKGGSTNCQGDGDEGDNRGSSGFQGAAHPPRRKETEHRALLVLAARDLDDHGQGQGSLSGSRCPATCFPHRRVRKTVERSWAMPMEGLEMVGRSVTL